MTASIRLWLESLGLDLYAETFEENDLDVDLAADLTDADLKDLGVASMGHRKKLLRAIEALAAASTAIESAPSTLESSPEPSDAATGQAERRQLTVLFCDLVGSTELSQRLDPEDLREVMRRYQDTVAGVVARFEGHVAKFLGDGVLAFFGWPRAYEDQAERAVRSGLAAVEVVAKLRTEDGQALEARVGIATGQVVIGDIVGETATEADAVAGETPNLAARLQGLAAPGQVVIGGTTRLLISETFDLKDIGSHELKGFAEPVQVWRVLSSDKSARDAAVEHIGASLPLIGRQEEMGLLLRSWETTKETHGQVVLIQGEAGIGKSRLVEALRERVSGEDYIWVATRCSPYHANSTLYPVIERLKRVLGWTPEDGAEARLEKLEAALEGQSLPFAEAVPLYAELLSLALPEGRYAPLELSAKQQREQTLDALAGWMLEMAERKPVLQVWDDLHWADPTTLELLALYIEQSPTVSMMNVLTYRPEFVPPWTMRSHMTPITLNRLERPEVEALIGHQANGKQVPSEVIEHIVSKADGVPLYVEELTKTILESDYLREEPERYTLSGSLSKVAIPATLQDSLMARLDRVPTLREVAQLGAVLGREFVYEMIQYLAPLEEPVLQNGLGQLVENELLYQRGRPPRSRYIFKHALIQDAAYQSLLKRTRQQYHRQVAAIIEDRFPETVAVDPELVARHYTEGGLVDAAVPYWQRAGKHAAEHSADAEAFEHLRKALKLLEDMPEGQQRRERELETLITLGPVLMNLKGSASPDVRDAYLRARNLCDRAGHPSQRFPVLWGLWLHYHMAGKSKKALALAHEAIDLAETLSGDDFLLQAHHAAWTTNLGLADFQTAVTHTDQGQTLYDVDRHRQHAFTYGGHDPGVCAAVLGAVASWFLGYPDQANKRSAKALELATAVAHSSSKADALAYAALLCLLRREPERALPLSDELINLSSDSGLTLWRANGQILRSWALSEMGKATEVLSDFREAIEHRQSMGSQLRSSLYLAAKAHALARAGDTAEAESAIEQALGKMEETGERTWETFIHWVRGEILATAPETEPSRAAACYQEASEIARRQGAKSMELRATLSLASLWLKEGRKSEARDLLAPIYDWFTEGFETADLKDAKTLLDDLA